MDEKNLVRLDNPFGNELAGELISLFGDLFGPGGDLQFILSDARPKRSKPQKVKYNDNIRFSYYGHTSKCNHHAGILIIASVSDELHGAIHYGMAFCSPKDTYDKALGKKLAYDDLVKNLCTVALSVKTHHGVSASILSDIVATNSYPSWAKVMVFSNLVRHLEHSY